jgi:hypothetical protein
MNTEHPITPPPELVQKWIKQCNDPVKPRWQEYEQDIANLAAQWGADQELEACCEWLVRNYNYPEAGNPLRTARRPKPPSLKEQALTALHAVATGANDTREQHQDLDTIRKALEQLNDK